MYQELRFLFGATSIALLLSCQQNTSVSTELTTEDEVAIRAANDAYIKLVSTADWQSLKPLITDDVIWMPPDLPALEGGQAVMDWVMEWPAFPNIWLTPIEIEGAGDIAFVRGNYGFGTGEAVVEGKYIEIRRKQPDGSWPISRTIYNTNEPAGQ